MTNASLPLFSWCPPQQIIPFPADRRTGHARKAAQHLAKARTNREADYALTRACNTLCKQLEAAGIPEDEIDRQHDMFLLAISEECQKIGAQWMPVLPKQKQNDGGGAA